MGPGLIRIQDQGPMLRAHGLDCRSQPPSPQDLDGKRHESHGVQ